MIAPAQLFCAFLLDLAIGDPPWLPHPVRIIGRAISGLERLLRGRFKGEQERAAGVLLVIVVVPAAAYAAYAAGRLLTTSSSPLLYLAGTAVLIYLISTTLALRGLVSAARGVIDAVRAERLAEGRQALAMIVGRDTDLLGQDGILRATIETLAENLSDGFVAPLFYLVVGGLAGAFAYKAINTLDSMVGYKNERYIRFGWAAARLDDAVNYIPARIAGLSLAGAAFIYYLVAAGPSRALDAARCSLAIMRRDGGNHTSPNSGVPEAAMAGALGVRLGGPSTYGGRLVEKAYIGDGVFGDYLSSASRAVALTTTGACLCVALALSVLGAARLL